jgi:hypothetical protein
LFYGHFAWNFLALLAMGFPQQIGSTWQHWKSQWSGNLGTCRNCRMQIDSTSLFWCFLNSLFGRRWKNPVPEKSSCISLGEETSHFRASNCVQSLFLQIENTSQIPNLLGRAKVEKGGEPQPGTTTDRRSTLQGREGPDGFSSRLSSLAALASKRSTCAGPEGTGGDRRGQEEDWRTWMVGDVGDQSTKCFDIYNVSENLGEALTFDASSSLSLWMAFSLGGTISHFQTHVGKLANMG